MSHRKLIYLTEEEENEEEPPRTESFYAVKQTVTTHNNDLSQILKKDLLKQQNLLRRQKTAANKEPVVNEIAECEVIEVSGRKPKRNNKRKQQNANPQPNEPHSEDEIILLDEISKTATQALVTDMNSDEQHYQEYLAMQESMPMKIKIKRYNRIEYFKIVPSQPMSSILDEVGQKFLIPVPNIILYLNDNQIDLKSSPKDLNISIADILEVMARVDNTNSAAGKGGVHDPTANDPSFITLHLRDNSKKKLTTRINRFKLVRDLAEYYAKEKGVNIDQVVLEFDSDKMSFDKKIDFFEMDDDDQIDVNVKS